MNFSNDEIRQYFKGVYTFKEIDGYLAFYRFSKEQIESFLFEEFYYDRTKFTASERLVFVTTAEKFSFDYKIVKSSIKDTFDLYIDGILYDYKDLNLIPLSGNLSFDLPKGNKKVDLTFPMDSEIYIKNFSADEKINAVSEKLVNVLWLGDSITQGAGGGMGGQTFANIVTRKMNYNSLNQGIGGFVYDSRVLKPLSEFIPDKIFVALGTNDGIDGFEQRVKDFYAKLNELYPETPKTVVTPLWRGDIPEKNSENIIKKEIICKVCSEYSYIKVIDGFDLVPHAPQCFWDNLHPNAWGHELFADNLMNFEKG